MQKGIKNMRKAKFEKGGIRDKSVIAATIATNKLK
jgi:hypothetical protein